jgi:hypothetical protein
MLGIGPAEDSYPEISPDSEVLHAVFYLLQEVGEFPLRFRFKGALAPYSADLSEIFSEYALERDFYGELADRGSLSDAAKAAIDRLTDIGRNDVPSAFVNSPPDYERWWVVLATYLFVARSPLYAEKSGEEAISDVGRLLPDVPLQQVQLEAAAERVRLLSG